MIDVISGISISTMAVGAIALFASDWNIGAGLFVLGFAGFCACLYDNLFLHPH